MTLATLLAETRASAIDSRLCDSRLSEPTLQNPDNKLTGQSGGLLIRGCGEAKRLSNAMNPDGVKRRVSVEFFEVPVQTVTIGKTRS
jgi:hypothetical protein